LNKKTFTLKEKSMTDLLTTKRSSGLLILALLISFAGQLLAEDTFYVSSKRLSERIMVVSTGEDFANQLVIVTDKGLVAINTVWSEKIAREYADKIKAEFDREDYRYVINLHADLMDVGGNSFYADAEVIAHQQIYDHLLGQSSDIDIRVKRREDTFREKVMQSEEQMNKYAPDSKEAKGWKSWRDICQRIADDISAGYKLRLPTMIFRDKFVLDLGDITLKLMFFGNSGSQGATWIHIPEEKILFVGAALHHAHLSPTMRPNPQGYDVPRWLNVMAEIIADRENVEQILTLYSGIMPIEKLEGRYRYIKEMWDAVNLATEQNATFETVQNDLTLDGKFSYIKEWDIYKNRNPEERWVENEHSRTLKAFWSETHESVAVLIEKELVNSGIKSATEKFEKLLAAKNNKYFFDAGQFNSLGYKMIGTRTVQEAIAVFKMFVKAYPESADAYDSLGEAYSINGETELAIKSYEKSLELNPENENVERKLDQLKKED